MLTFKEFNESLNINEALASHEDLKQHMLSKGFTGPHDLAPGTGQEYRHPSGHVLFVDKGAWSHEHNGKIVGLGGAFPGHENTTFDSALHHMKRVKVG
jgi:hypothetical protein